MAELLDDTACSMNEGKDQVKVTTLLDLKRRREALLAQKMIILKRKNAETDVTRKYKKLHPIPLDTVSDPGETITQNLPQALDNIIFEPTSSDDEIAQVDTITFSSKSIIFKDNIEIRDIQEKENDTNIINIDNLQFIEISEDCSFMDKTNLSLLDNIPTNELLPGISTTCKILDGMNVDESSSPQFAIVVESSSFQPDALATVVESSSSHPEELAAVGESPSLQTDALATVVESSSSQPEDLAAVCESSSPQVNEVAAVGESSTTQSYYLRNTDTYHGDLSINKKRKNKANKEPSKWKKNLNKNLRMKGEAYLGYRRDPKTVIKKKVYHDVMRPARTIKPACNSSFCKKSKLRNCDNINEDKRKETFELFWKTMSWEQRKIFVCSHVTAKEKKVTKNSQSRRSKTFAYFLTIENLRHQVCKKMFLNTLGIKNWFVRYWLEKTNSAMPPHSDHSRNINRSKKKPEAHEYLEAFLNSLPKMPSHYCRASTSRQYLEPLFQNMAQLYKEYNIKCEFESVECLSCRVFDNIFLKLNFSLYHPKKDRCDVCCGHEAGNITDAEIALHRERKEKARNEKETDKDLAKEGKCHVFTQDVQAVKLAPNLQASAIYYKTKLCVHNFTMYNLSTHEAVCYWFDESNASLEASVFASCIVDQLQCILDRKLLPVILFSDGCCAQNRNCILSNALLRLSIEKKVTITQKYLEKGHTQMECDSVHSAIECKLKGREIFLPSQYFSIAKTARNVPYDCRVLDYNFFTDFSKNLIYKTIRPGKKTNDPTVTDLKVLVYHPDGTIWYKLNFNDALQPLPQRPQKLTNVTPLGALPKLYAAKLPISQRKYQDLQDLKAVLPSYCHSFYDDLPYKR